MTSNTILPFLNTHLTFLLILLVILIIFCVMQQFIYKNHPIQFDFDDNYNKYENKHTEKQTIFINNIIKNKNRELQEKFTTADELLEKLSKIYYNRYIETINKGNAVAYNTFLQTQNPKENIYYKQYL